MLLNCATQREGLPVIHLGTFSRAASSDVPKLVWKCRRVMKHGLYPHDAHILREEILPVSKLSTRWKDCPALGFAESIVGKQVLLSTFPNGKP